MAQAMTEDADEVKDVALKIIELFGEAAARIIRKQADNAVAGGDSLFAYVLCDVADAIERLQPKP